MYREINGLCLYFRKSGVPSAPTVLLLHGWGCDSSIFQNIGEDFSRDFCVYVLDLPGFGKSEIPNVAWGVEDYADLVKTFMALEDLKQVHLIGHSFGGRIGIVIAAARDHPLQTLILVNSAGLRKLRRRLRSTLMILLAKLFKVLIPFQTFRETYVKPYLYKMLGNTDYLNAGPLKETFVKVIGQDLSEFVKAIKIPTLLIWGENDQETPMWMAQKMNELISHSHLVVFPQAGHFSFLDAPERFKSEVRNFLNKESLDRS